MDLVTDCVEALFDDRDEEFLFIPKMKVKGASGHIGELSDLGDRGILIAVGDEDLPCGSKQVSPHTSAAACDPALFRCERRVAYIFHSSHGISKLRMCQKREFFNIRCACRSDTNWPVSGKPGECDARGKPF